MTPNATIEKRDDSSAAYDVRTLANDAEVEQFLDHLGIVFGVPKANGAPGAPRSLFQDHWVNDPYADKDGVAVAFADGLKGGKEVVSSVRTYVRKMHLAPGITIQVGGIGDVATQVEHRGKRLASKLMAMSEDYMKSKGIPFAVLHAAPAAAPLYASLGWKACGLGFYNLNIQPGELADLGKSKSACRKLNTLSFEDVVVARSLFERVAPSVAGTFARHHAKFWTHWVPASGDARRKASRMILPGTKTSDVVAYMVIVVMASDLTTAASSTSLAVEVREFFAGRLEDDVILEAPTGWETAETSPTSITIPRTSSLTPLEFLEAFASLLHSSLEQLSISASTTAIKLTLPSPLFPPEALDVLSIKSPSLPLWITDPSRRTNDNDAFWMYKTLSPFTVAGKDGNDVEIDSVEKALALFFEEPVGVFAGCTDVICDRTRRGGFFRTDNF